MECSNIWNSPCARWRSTTFEYLQQFAYDIATGHLTHEPQEMEVYYGAWSHSALPTTTVVLPSQTGGTGSYLALGHFEAVGVGHARIDLCLHFRRVSVPPRAVVLRSFIFVLGLHQISKLRTPPATRKPVVLKHQVEYM